MTNRNALVIGASGGVGSALVAGLAAQGYAVTALSRSTDGLDVTDEASIAQSLERFDGPFQRVIVATGQLHGAGTPPEKALSHLTPEAMQAQFAVNAMGPMLVLKHARPLLPRREPAVFAALSARVGSIGDNQLGGWYSYRAAKAALNQFLHSAAIELARSHPRLACVALHPGTVVTSFTAAYRDRHVVVAPEVAAGNLLSVIDELTSEDSGGFFDWAGKRIPW